MAQLLNMDVYRITTKKWSKKLIASGYSARWNSSGVYILYTASSRSLACLENIVHRTPSELIIPFITMVICIPDSIKFATINLSDLPENWDLPGEDGYQLSRPFGDKWIRDNETAILKVPSAIIKNDFNILLNPNHKDFKEIKIIDEEPFCFDSRIKNIL